MIFCLGGAFNPPTRAHKKIYETIRATYPEARFIFLPVGDVYAKPMAPAQHRLAMVEIMIAGENGVWVEDLELHDATYQGAIHSLERLEMKYGEPVIFVLGMDQAVTLPTWKKASRLLTNHQFLVIRRPGVNNAPLEAIRNTYSSAIYDILDLDIDVSSTAFRAGKNPALLEERVHQYILDHQLYKESSWPD